MAIVPPDDTTGGGVTALTYTTAGINNPGFEEGNTGWTIAGGWLISNSGPRYAGGWAANIDTNRTGSSESNTDLINTSKVDVLVGAVINARGRCYGAGRDGNIAAVMLIWYNASDGIIRKDVGNFSNYGSHKTWDISTVRGTAPTGAVKVAIGFRGTSSENGNCAVDNAEWDYGGANTVTLTSPVTGSIYNYGESIPLQVTITGTNPYPTKVEYLDSSDNILATSTVAPFSGAISTLDAGTYSIRAKVYFSDAATLETDTASVVVGPEPPAPGFEEYAASNAYSYLILDGIFGIASQIPATAKITGVEVTASYTMEILTRSKDKEIDDPAASTTTVLFDIVNEAKVEAVLLEKVGGQFVATGSPMYGQVAINPDDFGDYTGLGVSEGKYLSSRTYITDDETNIGEISIGANPSFYSPEQSLFGLQAVAATDFLSRAIGLRIVPTLNSIPDYADSGDAVIRFGFAKIRVKVYFDAGSALYYFASPDKTDVISAELVHATVEAGNFTTSDASGVLQVKPTLTIVDGTQTYIGDDWTIHGAYPPTDANQIGQVVDRDYADGIGISYNSLPSAGDVIDGRSRYEFITSNFYGDKDLISMYGVNGVGRAFAYNGDFFYNIQDHPDPDKDKPRHIANHHGHLALGYAEGRVDISVAGQPYNFDGSLGASSWALGDNNTGLLPLSGTILGAFCGSSIWGISGTTVDNFATQIISPQIGAIEYTVTDMGFPVYANAYGVYTLSQTQQYGDYLGTPMSQDISPWLRPRLIRKNTSDKEVIVAWPVRTKNQYKIAFADGYIMSMTINGGMQAAPTFSFQKYTLYTDEELGL